MKQSTSHKRGAWFRVGVTLLSISALLWLIIILLIVSEGDGAGVLVGVLFTAIPIGIGIYCVRRGRKAPTAGVIRDSEPENLVDAESVESLISSLRHEDESVRRQAAEALGEIGDTRAVKPLTRTLKDDTWVVQAFAKEAIEKIKAKQTLK